MLGLLVLSALVASCLSCGTYRREAGAPLWGFGSCADIRYTLCAATSATSSTKPALVCPLQPARLTISAPNKWKDFWPACGVVGTQSPINIESANVSWSRSHDSDDIQAVPKVGEPLKISFASERLPGNITLTNNGHTVVLNANLFNAVTSGLDFGSDSFTLASAHFHWGVGVRGLRGFSM